MTQDQHPDNPAWIDQIPWQKLQGLLPVLVQDRDSHQVLMLGYMNPEALNATLSGQRLVFWSRSKQRLWEKGETSGHYLHWVELHLDCDQDALLAKVIANGPCCHLGETCCFTVAESNNAWDTLVKSNTGALVKNNTGALAKNRKGTWIEQNATPEPTVTEKNLQQTPKGYPGIVALEARIRQRKQGLATSPKRLTYTQQLLTQESQRLAQKVGEEGVEVALAAVCGNLSEVTSEAADLLYHLLVLLASKDLTLNDVEALLRQRAESYLSGT